MMKMLRNRKVIESAPSFFASMLSQSAEFFAGELQIPVLLTHIWYDVTRGSNPQPADRDAARSVYHHCRHYCCNQEGP